MTTSEAIASRAVGAAADRDVPPRPPVPTGAPTGLVAPPAAIPLGFLVAAGLALVGFGVALVWTAPTIVRAPMAPRAVATVHLGLLAFLTTAILGATHQFGPVVGGRPLRSPAVAYVTMALFVPASWALPIGFATDHPGLVEAAGVAAATAICLAAWNLSRPLLARGRGTSVAGLRTAVGYLVVTAGFGATYALDLHHGWFALMPRRVLTHAHLGLVGWAGLAYVAVAEKLWPMFLLAHPRWTTPGQWAVRLLAGGVALLATGLMIDVPVVAGLGGAALVTGLVAHLLSLASVVRHRRRALELLHGFVVASAACAVVAIAAGIVAGIAPLSTDDRMRVVAVEVGALTMWLTLAVVGHVHKVVPFIAWGRLRERGVTTTRDGSPLLFAHLFDATVARVTLASAVVAATALLCGLAAGVPELIRVAGCAAALTGALATGNLVNGPRAASRAARSASTTSAVAS